MSVMYRHKLCDNLNDLMLNENAIAIERMSLNSLVINQQNDMINLLISRNTSLLDKFASVVSQLCQAMIDMMEKVDNCKDIIHAKLQVQAQEREWLQLENEIKARRQMLIVKCKGKTPKQKYHNLMSKSRQATIDGRMKGTFSHALHTTEDIDYKTRIRNQFIVIKQFVSSSLTPKLQYHPSNEIPKKIILNIYLRWNRQVQRTLQFSDTVKIQMELTNQLKVCFPKMKMSRTTFRGIQFRPQLIEEHFDLTDRSPPFQEDHNFIDKYGLHSIDDILDEYQQAKQQEEVNQE